MSSEQLLALFIDVIVAALLLYGTLWFASRGRWVGTVLCTVGVFYQGIALGQTGGGAPSSSLGGLVWLAMFHVAMSVSFALIARRLGRNPYLYGTLFFVPVTMLVAMGMLAGSPRPDAIESSDSDALTGARGDT